jgi:hypothetical protein
MCLDFASENVIRGFVGQYDKYPDFPIGPPQLMMSYTNDGQVPQQMVKERDE